VFPYPSFTRITDSDALAIKVYLFSLPAVRRQNRPHDVPFPFSWRFLQTGWKLLFSSGAVRSGARAGVPPTTAALISFTALAHWRRVSHPAQFPRRRCDPASGSPGPRWTGGQLVPNITPDPDTGIGKWEKEDVVETPEDRHHP